MCERLVVAGRHEKLPIFDCQLPIENAGISIRDQQSSISNHLHVPGLFFTEAQVVASQTKFDRVAHRGAANDFHTGAIAEAHLEEPAAKIGVASNGENAAPAPDAELI
jgi:hypothetical protein